MIQRKFLQRRSIALSLLVLCTSISWAGEAESLLRRMGEAASTLNYEGTFVYVEASTIEAMKVVQGSIDGEQRQRLWSLNGPEQELLLAGDEVICRQPDGASYRCGDSRRAPGALALSEDLENLAGHYRFAKIGEDRVAGHKTVIVAIEPKDKLRFGYKLWLHKGNGMVLRSALLDERSRVLEQILFTEIEFKDAISEDKLGLTNHSASKPADSAPDTEITDSNWAKPELPNGFKLAQHKRFSQRTNRTTEHIVYSDGLASVSVFLEPRFANKPMLNGPARMGAMNAFGVEVGEFQAVVVGEVPGKTVAMIAHSIRLKE